MRNQRTLRTTPSMALLRGPGSKLPRIVGQSVANLLFFYYVKPSVIDPRPSINQIRGFVSDSKPTFIHSFNLTCPARFCASFPLFHIRTWSKLLLCFVSWTVFDNDMTMTDTPSCWSPNMFPGCNWLTRGTMKLCRSIVDFSCSMWKCAAWGKAFFEVTWHSGTIAHQRWKDINNGWVERVVQNDDVLEVKNSKEPTQPGNNPWLAFI